jgi:uncharacterized glyoxalase superfamily protein PhnB/uncharacterized protein YndB with AHSA1/START domain
MFECAVERMMPVPVATLYRAWTTGWGQWFAEPDSVRLTGELGTPFFFEVAQRDAAGVVVRRHPHYGRFLLLEREARVQITWLTGGTEGAETVVTVSFTPEGDGTRVQLTHTGFASERARDAHTGAWPMVLEQQELKLRALTDWPVDGRDALQRNRSIPHASLIPVRSYPDLDAAVTWLHDALGCQERLRIPGHRVQLTVGNGAVIAVAWDAASAPASGGRPPATLMLRVAHIDAVYARALAMGATAVTPPADQPYGERQAVLRDPAGHSWTLTQTIADADPASWGGELVRES